jgi:hypothetical protein
MPDCRIKHFLIGFILTRSFSRLFSPRFSITLFTLTSAAWEADAFYSRGGIVDTCKAMFHSFLDGRSSTRRADAWRSFCRYVRYVCDCITVRQDTNGAELTKMEQGHVSTPNTMDGLTEIFAMVSTTILLRIIDRHNYATPRILLSTREEEEITLAQSEAQTLVRFLTNKVDLVEDETGNNVSVEQAFASYLTFQGRWLLWCLSEASHIQRDVVCRHLLACQLLQDKEIFQEEEVWKEWGGEAPDCFWPVDKLLKIDFAIKRKSVGNPTDQPSKRQRI